jgi:WD40 repeat protein
MFATAVQDGDGNLNVTTWYADHYTIERRSSASAGRVGLVSVCPLSAPFSPDVRYVLATAVQDGDGNLKVIIWYVDGEGNLERKGSASAGPISLVSVIPIDFMDFEPTVLSTVVKTDSGDLKVIIWEVDDEGNLVRRGSASAGSVGLISAADLTRVGIDGGRFVIAVQDGDGNLKIIGWNVDKESLEVTRLGSATAGAVSLISCCRYPFLDEFLFGGFVTAIRDGSGNLKIIGWIMDRDGNLERNDDGSAGRIGLVSAQAVDLTPL